MSKRLIAYPLLTVMALTLLFSFRTPASSKPALGVPGQVAVVPGTTAAPQPASSKANGTYTGAAVAEPYGLIQVQVTLASGKITNVTPVQIPTNGRSGYISQTAAPILSGEAISAQTANIDTVSGATYTSQAYAQSLQSALDQARA